MHIPTGEILNDIKFEEPKLSDDMRKPSSLEEMAKMAEAVRQGRPFNVENKLVGLQPDEAEKLKVKAPPQRKNWMRNQPCVCGSGKKFKRCCWSLFK